MLDFMDYIQLAFSEVSGWNRDNSYSNLTDTAKALLDFSTPERLRVHLSSLSSPQFATSYTLGTVGLVDGSVSYLYSTLSLDSTPSRSALIPLRHLVPGYRQIYTPHSPPDDWWKPIAETVQQEQDQLVNGIYRRSNSRPKKPTLLHATLHLPPPTTLTALFLHRPSPSTKLSLALYSTQATYTSKSAPPQASVLAHLCHDTGKYSSEFLFSTDNALLGFRGLWNFGPDLRKNISNQKPSLNGGNTTTNKGDDASAPPSHSVSLLSAGGEVYYSPISSVIGLSTGLRFTTLSAASEASGPSPSPSSSTRPTKATPATSSISTFPYTLTLTLTPLTGSLSTTYSLLASPNLAFSSRFGFNVYSWESEMVAGCELWRGKQAKKPLTGAEDDDLAWARKKIGLLSPRRTTSEPPSSSSSSLQSDSSESVIKLRLDQSWNLRLLWEGRIKDLLVSAGVTLGPVPPLSSGMAGGSSKGYGWTGVGVSVLYST
ncbi:Mitochondrial distribution and morphology protein 10 [Myotisia sp. PD_48]|nr:Mitochondrial distribution and morphology protein 10 [Myotisia sp. PD_48]